MTTTAIEKSPNIANGLAVDREAVLKTLGLNPRDPNVQALVLTCQTYDLDPVLGHMVLIQNKPYVTHRGLWHIAHRTELLNGEETVASGETEKEWWATVAIYRKDWAKPITMTGRYPKNGTNKNYGPEMAVTRAECLVLRRLFDVSIAVKEEQDWPAAETSGGGTSRETVSGESPGSAPSGDKVPDYWFERYLARAKKNNLSDDDITQLVEYSTDGRTNVLAQVVASELDVLREATRTLVESRADEASS